MARLPHPGGDAGDWGAILNDYLIQSHKADGTLKDNAVTAAAIAYGSVSKSKLEAAVQTSLDKADAALTASVANATYALAGPATGVPAATITPVVVKNAESIGAAPWEYVHDGGAGYIWHLIMGQNSSDGSWAIGIGVDSGSGGGAIIRNKAAGIGLKLEQMSSVSAANAYALSIDHQSATAPAVFAELKGNATDLIHCVSYRTTPGAYLLKFSGPAGVGLMGGIQAHDGVFRWEKAFDLVGGDAKIDARSADYESESTRHHTYFDVHGVSWANNSGTADIYYQSRIRHQGVNLVFEASDNAALGEATYETVLAIGKGEPGWKKLGFFGATPVSKPSALTAADTSTVDDTYGTEEAVVITNLRTRVNELETKLRALGLIA